MSLIADALKAAQKDREEQTGRAEARQRRASSTLRSNASIPISRKKSGRTPAALWGSFALLAGAVAVAGYLLARPSGPDEQLAASAGSERPVRLEDGFGDPAGGGGGGGGVPQRMLSEIPPSAISGQPSNVTINPAPASQPYVEEPVANEQSAGSQIGARLSGVRDALADRLNSVGIDGGGFSSSLLSLGRGITDNLGIDGLVGTTVGSREQAEEPVGPPPVIELTVRQREPVDDQIFQDAVQAQQVGDLQRAAELYGEHLEDQPAHAEALNNLGTVLQASGDLSGARAAFERALRANPNYGVAWSNLGMLLEQMGEESEALAALSQSLRLDPGNLAARVNLALIHQRRGLTGEARQTLQQVLDTDPTYAEAHYALAALLDNQMEQSAAIRHYREFLEYSDGRFPDHAVAVRLRLQQLESYGIR